LRHYDKLYLLLLGAALWIYPAPAHAQEYEVTCSSQTQTPNVIRNEGKTEQIADYSFSCLNYGSATTVTVSATISPTVAITSKALTGGLTEAALIVQDSTGQQMQQTIPGTVSGNIVTFGNFTLPQSSNTSAYQPFNLTVTNIRVDTTPMTASSTLSETVSVSGTNVSPATFTAAQIAQVQPGLSAQSVTGAVNFPVCSTVTPAAPAFTVKFGENSLSSAAFKTEGGSGNTTVGSWAANNTETGYLLQNDGVPLNQANSGTRLRILFTNIPNNISVYVPLTVASDQLVETTPAGTLGLTATEAGPYSVPGYDANTGLTQLTVTNGTAEAVYQVQSDSATLVESYQVAVYLASSGVVSPQNWISAAVSFAPVEAPSNIPNFAQLANSTLLNGSQFPACLIITSTTLPNGVLTLPYNQTIGVGGGIPPYTWSLVESALPSSLTLNSTTGAISGYPGTVGVSSFVVRVTDSAGQATTQVYSFYVDPAVTISSAYRVPDATVGETYSTTLTATGGYGSYTWALTGSLQQQTGLTFSAGGVIGGIPTASGFYTALSATVTDSSGATATGPVNILINTALRITTASLPLIGVVGTAYPATPAVASGGSGGNAWSITSGSLAGTGLSFSSQGVFSGTPLAPGSISLTLKVTDQGGASVTQPVTITINPALAIPATPLLPTGVQGVYYSQQLPSTGGSGTNQWILAERGTLPSGISLSPSGLLYGTSTTNGAFNFTAGVTDSFSDAANQPLTLQVNPPVTFTSAATLPGTINGTPYTTTLAATGGFGSYTFSTTGVPYPLTLNDSTGVISGTTNTAGTLTFAVTVTDTSGSAATQQFSILVSPGVYLNFVSIVDGSSPLGYFRLENLSGGTSDVNGYTYTPSGAGVTFVSGIPNGVSNNNAVKLDGASGDVTTSLAGGVNTAGSVMAWVDMSALPSVLGQFEYVAGESQSGNDFDLQFTTDNILRFYTTNDNQNLSYTPAVGTLLNQWHMIVATFDNTAGQRAIYWDGQLVATDTAQSLTGKTGAFEIGNSSVFGGRYFDGAIDEVAVWNYALTPSQVAQIYDEPLGTLPNGIQNQAYGPYTIAAAAGSGSYTYSATGVPAGLTLSSSGVLSGQPTTAAASYVMVQATDTVTSQTSSLSLLLTVSAPVSISPATLSAAAVNVPYTGTLVASGGSGTGYQFALATGSTLPAGMSLSPAGVLSGAPQVLGVASFTVVATDSNGMSGQQALSLTIDPAVTFAGSSSLAGAMQGVAYSQTLTAAGGFGSYTFSVAMGSSLPSWLSLNTSTGALTGTPTGPGNYSFALTVLDSSGSAATQTFSLTVSVPPLSIVTTTLSAATQAVPYSQSVSATGGSGSYTWSVTQGTFTNAGLALNSSTGTITGTPVTADTLTFTVQVSDGFGHTAFQTFNLFINLAYPATYDFAVVNEGSSIERVSADGTRTSAICTGAACHPRDIAADTQGVVYAHDNQGIAKITPAGVVTQIVSFGGNAGVGGIALDGLGNIIFVDNALDAVFRVATDGTGLAQVAAFPVASPDELQDTYVTLDRFGNYVVVSDDNGATKVYSFTPSGAATTLGTFAGRGTAGVAVDASGNVIFTDYLNYQVVSVNSSGTPTVLAQANCCSLRGLTLDPATGQFITGSYGGALLRITQTGAVTTIVNGNPLTLPVSVTPIPLLTTGPLTVSPPSLASGTVGQSYGPFTMSATGGSGSYTWSATGLPTGVTISGAGVLSGIPSASGSFSAQITATDSLTAQTGSANITVLIGATVGPLTITGGSASFAIALGTAINTTYTAAGGVMPYSWTWTGLLPPGLTLTSMGVLSGLITQPGNYSFNVQVNDIEPVSTAKTVTVSVLGLTTGSLPSATATLPYLAPVAAAGGTGPYTFTGTGFPAGLSISGSGVIGGGTTLTGPFSVAIKVTDSTSLSSSATFSLMVNRSPVSVSTSTLPNGAVGIPYSQTLTAAGGAPPYIWSISSGVLPLGLSLNTAGAISGNPTASGSFSFTVKATDTNGASGASMLSLAVAPIVSIALPTLPAGTLNQAYGPITAAATGGSGIYTWTATGLPSGISIAPATGSIGGNPSVSGSFSGTITATDATTHQTATQAFSIMVTGDPALSITSAGSPPPVALGGSVSGTFTASGGKPPYTWTASGLPANVTLSSGGVLSGAPSQPGVFTASATVTDSQPSSVNATVTVNVFGLTSSSLAGGVAGQFYSASIGATGGSPPYSFSAAGLPSGLSLSAAGNLSGAVAAANTYTFSITARDSGGLTASANFSLTIGKPQPISITSGALTAGAVNAPYSQSLSASGGVAPYTWALSAGALPPGLSLGSSGTLSGIPTAPGPFSFGAMATDGAGAIATTTVSLTVQAAPLAITTQNVPSGVNGLGYPQQVLGASGGVVPYTWAVTSGSLPAGMSLSPDGSLTGVPMATGSFPVTMTATDKAGSTGMVKLDLSIRAAGADLILSSGSLSFSLMTPSMVTPPSQATGVQSTQSNQQIPYAVSLSPAAPWLAVTNGSTTPDTLQVSIAPAALALSPGDYTTTIAVKCSSGGCTGSTQSVSVDLKVMAAPPRLLVVTDLLSFGAMTGSPPQAATPSTMTQSVTIQNAGGGSIGIGNISCEAAWCTAGGGPATLAGGMSASLAVSINPALLTAGFFRTQVDIATSAGTASVPVTVLVSANSTMTLAPVGTQFTMQAGGAPGNASGSFLVTVANSAAVNWGASVLPGSPWLTLTGATGASSASSPGTVSYAIDPAGAAALAPGVYYGQIGVTSSAILNSPLSFEVVLSVSPVTVAVIPDPEPAGLLFIAPVGGVVPQQTVTVYSGSTAVSGFQASATTMNGGNWLSVGPQIGNAASGSPGITSVTVDTAGLKQGVYTGGVSYSLSATAVREVNVTLIVTPAGSGASRRAVSPKDAACTPSVLVPVQTGLVNNFSAAVAWPTPLTVVLANDCGSPINSGQLVATFSNGDPPLPLALADPSKGLYSGTWTPRKSVAQMTVIAHASAAGYPEATAQVVGAATPNSAPLLTPHGTLHSFDPLVGAALAPGTIIQIYGQNLASQTAQPATIPLPTTMNGTSVIIGGMPAPLYYVSAAQINAQLPFELTPGNQYQVLISANGALTTPDTVQLSAATPGLAAFADSTLIAQHGDGTLVSATAPAKPGEYLVAYLAGMGGTNATPASGAASPGNPLALPSLPPVLTLNGAVYPIAFAGLTPGLVGLYQMNFQVPAGLPAGNLAMVVNQNGALSNQTVLPYAP
jgi:hypothetical protein